MAKRTTTTSAFASPASFVQISRYPAISSPAITRRPPIRCASGQGFGRNESSGKVTSPEREAPWALAYKSYVQRNGELLCAMAWEGYERLGRGAVFANYTENVGNVGVARPGTGKFSAGTPSFYVSRDQLVARNEADTIPQMAPILRRIAAYDPDRQFVVVFESDGTQGADIVTPNQRPVDVWKGNRGKKDDAIDVDSSE